MNSYIDLKPNFEYINNIMDLPDTENTILKLHNILDENELNIKIKDYQTYVDIIQYLEYKIKELDVYIGEILLMKPVNVSIQEHYKQKDKLRREIEKIEISKEKLRKEIYEKCNHEWIEDYIDSLDGLKKIEYCNVCNLSKPL